LLLELSEGINLAVEAVADALKSLKVLSLPNLLETFKIKPRMTL
jgi:hypothetical protein